MPQQADNKVYTEGRATDVHGEEAGNLGRTHLLTSAHTMPGLLSGLLPFLVAAAMAWVPSSDPLGTTPQTDPEHDSPDNDAARHLDRELQELARGLSHDVAGPLRTLDSALRLVESDIESGRTIRSKATLAAVRKQARHLSGVSTALVGYCRRAWKDYSVQASSLPAVVGSIVADLTHPGRPTLEVRVPELAFAAEVDALSQALRELVHNALIHHDKGSSGRVTIHAQLQPPAKGHRSHQLLFVIEDDGPGIASDMREVVFDFFRRAATKAEGAGLGLSLSRTLAQRFGGQLTLLEARPRGTRARLTWPVNVDLGPGQQGDRQ